MLAQIILQIVLIALNAVFACAEIAVISSSPAKLEKMADSGNKKAKALRSFVSEPDRFLATIQVAVTLSGFIGAAFAARNFADWIVGAADSIGIPERILEPAAVVAVTLVLSCFTLVFGVIVPKRAAMKNPEKLALSMYGLIRFVQAIFAPMVWILNISANAVLRLIGVDPKKEVETVTEEEIIMMSDAGAEKGTIDETENRIIKNVFAFGDLTAEQVCTHRTDVSVLWSSDPVEVWEETIHRTRHSSLPICGESIDSVIGILNAKDYFRLEDKSRENIMENAVREPYFVHENMKADRLFAKMKNGEEHFAVVVDEYGGMSGIITVTDLVEELVGDFDDDELDEPEAEFRRIDGDRWLIPGITEVDEVCEELDICLPADKHDTFGGYVISQLGEIPKEGSNLSIDSHGLHIEILEIHHHRVELCRVTRLPEPAEEEES